MGKTMSKGPPAPEPKKVKTCNDMFVSRRGLRKCDQTLDRDENLGPGNTAGREAAAL